MKLINVAIISSISTLTAYGLYEAYKYYRYIKENTITVEELLNEKEMQVAKEIAEDLIERQKVKKSTELKIDASHEEIDIIPEDDFDDLITYSLEELQMLHFNPNDVRALEQYNNLKMFPYRNLLSEHKLDILKLALDSYVDPGEFTPRSRGLLDDLLAKRTDFFGSESQFSENVSWGEILIYYAEDIQDEFMLDAASELSSLLGSWENKFIKNNQVILFNLEIVDEAFIEEEIETSEIDLYGQYEQYKIVLLGDE